MDQKIDWKTSFQKEAKETKCKKYKIERLKSIQWEGYIYLELKNRAT